MNKIFGEEFVRTTPQYIKYKQWFEEALDNARFVYYRGTSLTETFTSDALGKIIMQDAYKGEVLLFQKRVSKTAIAPFEYIAIRRRKAPRKLVPNKLIQIAA